MRVFIIILSVLALAGCAGGPRELKAPCGPSASLSQNPCDPIPLNVATRFNVSESRDA